MMMTTDARNMGLITGIMIDLTETITWIMPLNVAWDEEI